MDSKKYFVLERSKIQKKIVWNMKLFISLPFIYGMIIPAFILHVFLELYHQICFRLYSIERVDPKKYFVLDRNTLGYLHWTQKSACVYCSYFNALIAYTREIAGRTEKLFCPIKHKIQKLGTHPYYDEFLEYGDEESFRTHQKQEEKQFF